MAWPWNMNNKEIPIDILTVKWQQNNSAILFVKLGEYIVDFLQKYDQRTK